MSDLALDVARIGSSQEAGVFHAGSMVQTRAGLRPCVLAASCLLEPAEGDRVLLFVESSERCYVLAVLERAQPTLPSRISLPGDVALCADGGRMAFTARDGIAMTTPATVEIGSTGLEVSAVRADIGILDFRFVGEMFQGCLDRIKLTARSLDSTLERLSESIGQALRFVSDADRLRAGQIDHEARETVRIHGNHAVVTANRLVKVDADQIHMG